MPLYFEHQNSPGVGLSQVRQLRVGKPEVHYSPVIHPGIVTHCKGFLQQHPNGVILPAVNTTNQVLCR
jgi:hypothetical protein